MMTLTWLSRHWQLRLVGALAIAGAVATVGSSAIAQVRPDNTLGAERSQVRANGPGAFQIDGGATRGTNLFHSFSQFSVPTKGVAFFNNALSIQNIISRVTGGSVSNIDGLLKANGAANLFLINPNGIIFGPNASLNIGGSFFASTANSMKFADGTAFSAKTPEANPLLTVSVPIGLQYGTSAGSITNQSTAVNSSNIPVGLQVKPGNTLALVGGDVSLDGGRLTASGGRVELGGLTGAGTIGLSGNGSLSYPAGVQRADVSLTNGAYVNVTAGGGGSIAVNARNLEVSGSKLRAGIRRGLGSVGSVAGDITLDATGEIKVVGEESTVINNVQPQAMGNGGNIIISTGSLSLTDGAQLVTSSFGKGNAGNVRILASGNISFDGHGTEYDSAVFTTVDQTGMGNGGDIYIQSSSLSLTNGGELVAGVSQGGQGNSGNVTVNVKNSINVSGVDTNDGSSSGLFADTEENSKGQGGEILLGADALKISDGATLSARTRNAFRGGNIIVKVNNLDLTGGGQILTAAFDKGNAGDITINATKGITISGSDPTFNARLAQFGRPLVDPVNSLSGLFANTTLNSTGNGGTISINPTKLTLTDGASVAVNSLGKGNAGNLNIQAGSVTLDRGASITAATASSEGGNINLQAQNLLQLRHGSNISATAGTANAGGNGGNITINTPFIVSAPLENSDITANAFSGKGGNVNINAQGIFWLEPLSLEQLRTLRPNDLNPNQLLTNDITAISQQGGPLLSGQVTINTSGIDPSRGLVPLPAVVVDKSGLIAQGCAAGNGTTGSQFVVTGRGGLPPNPGEPLSSDAVWSDTRLPATTVKKHHSQAVAARQPSPPAAVPMVPATGWVFNGKGEVTLTASAPNDTIQIPWITPATCHAQ